MELTNNGDDWCCAWFQTSLLLSFNRTKIEEGKRPIQSASVFDQNGLNVGELSTVYLSILNEVESSKWRKSSSTSSLWCWYSSHERLHLLFLLDHHEDWWLVKNKELQWMINIDQMNSTFILSFMQWTTTSTNVHFISNFNIEQTRLTNEIESNSNRCFPSLINESDKMMKLMNKQKRKKELISFN